MHEMMNKKGFISIVPAQGAEDLIDDVEIEEWMHPVNAAIIRITSEFDPKLQKLAWVNDSTRLKSNLRLYIDALEELYRQLDYTDKPA